MNLCIVIVTYTSWFSFSSPGSILDLGFFTQPPAAQSAVKIYWSLIEWAEQRSAGPQHTLEKRLGSRPVACSAVCLWQLPSPGTGPKAAVRRSCPQSLRTVASHTLAEVYSHYESLRWKNGDKTSNKSTWKFCHGRSKMLESSPKRIFLNSY